MLICSDAVFAADDKGKSYPVPFPPVDPIPDYASAT